MPPQQTNITSGTERDAAGLGLDLPVALPTAASTRNVLGLLKRYWRAIQERRQHQSLAYLNDRELMDIGLTRGDIDHITPQRAIDRIRDSAMYLLSRGM
ncbi:DUF1127 domain-containing protein [Bradyrhizobium sp. AUGA SZCCT0222]|uniref:DUF1127 domain-containing protein n=1 Tax=Bradyrhizobium sp. AUGA SZCCT0222 TaxID=2807668 RepID=UPI001BA7ABD5|nr:DUF1127 domain-containing protein [Bradyrhizobium sp. AUGA SZCCT0222]MBR1270221.1 DUF1127 domain-containing protein [Bradyrhizobium sp. AUGA SZCCT0222]